MTAAVLPPLRHGAERTKGTSSHRFKCGFASLALRSRIGNLRPNSHPLPSPCSSHDNNYNLHSRSPCSRQRLLAVHRPPRSAETGRHALDGCAGPARYVAVVRSIPGIVTAAYFFPALGVLWHQPARWQTHRAFRSEPARNRHRCALEIRRVCL